ncbi:MAG: DUF4412 domain-containing protein [Cyclonatronaceae bacterium]
MKHLKALLKPGLRFSLLVLLASSLLPVSNGMSQEYFEGTLVFRGYELNNGEMQESGSFTMVCNSERMRIYTDGEKTSTEMLPGVESDQILIRHDKKDFVIFTSETEALSITKTDIEGIFGMFKAFMNSDNQSQTAVEPSGELLKTGKSESFNGIRASQWIYTSDDNEEVHLWMSENLKLNWGMFKEPWFSELSTDFSGPFGKIIDEGYVPLKVEAYKDGELNMVLETEKVDRHKINNSDLDVPAGMQIKTLQQLMMEQFQGRN